MKRVIVNIGNKTYKCQVAKNEEELICCLQNIDNFEPRQFISNSDNFVNLIMDILKRD